MKEHRNEDWNVWQSLALDRPADASECNWCMVSFSWWPAWGPARVLYGILASLRTLHIRKAGLLPPGTDAKRQEIEDVAHTQELLPDGPIREKALETIHAIVGSTRQRSLQNPDLGYARCRSWSLPTIFPWLAS